MSVVLMTGCGSGIGLETALAFARRGDTTVATMRNLAKADALQQRAADDGVQIHVEPMDVCDEASVNDTTARVLRTHGAVDVLVNNAGVGTSGPVETQSLDLAMRLMDTNFWGAMRAVRSVLPAVREQRTGVIINVSSLASRLPATIYGGMYAASKQALNALSEALAGEVDRFGIRVVSIEPGFLATEIVADLLSKDEPLSDVYGAGQEWIRRFMDGSADVGADAANVATAILAAAQDPETPLHRPVGDDAAMYLDILSQVDGYEGWMEAVLPIVEGTVGPRPEVAETTWGAPSRSNKPSPFDRSDQGSGRTGSARC
jgi:NAD(P)-dependent dehydrogenase (short-subunit alcohol dehydrogenase family)